jgi:hypothetical protein
MLKPIGRRGALAGLAVCVAGGNAWGAPTGFPETTTLLVAGPPGGRADRWAELMAPALGRALQQGAALSRENVGGADGVTGANQFEARAEPDGSTALVVPGSAALSWLCGDLRVKFDAGHWIPVWGGNASAALASRLRLVPGQRLRVGVQSVVGPELAALLALDLMGIPVVPVALTADGPNPITRPDIDAVFLHGADLRNRGEALAAAGLSLALGFGTTGPDGAPIRDPAFPDLPIAQELIGRPRHDAGLELVSAMRAVIGAARLDLALVLPQLSPAAIVAWWRRGCGALAQTPELQAEAARSLVRPISPQHAGTSTAAIMVDLPVLLELRRWLAERYQWRPA